MKRLTNLIICMSILTVMSAQKDTHVIKVSPAPLYSQFGFEIVEILDKRLIKSNVGFAQKGMANRRVKAVLPDSFPSYLLNTIESILPDCEDCPEIICIVHEFNVSEETKAMNEIGTFRIQLEFARREANKLYSLGFIEKKIIGKGMDVTLGHAKRILEGIHYCLFEFRKLEWKNKQGELIEFDVAQKFDQTKIPKAGLYSTFSKMCKDEPFETEGYRITNTKEKYPKYHIRDKKGMKLKKKVMGFSDGTHIYINASAYSYESHYVKSKQIGKYLYFEDRFADPMAGLMFGLVGSALSNTPKAIILDTTTGLVIKLDAEGIENFLNQHPKIKFEYNNSRKKIQDKFEAIEKVNAKFK